MSERRRKGYSTKDQYNENLKAVTEKQQHVSKNSPEKNKSHSEQTATMTFNMVDFSNNFTNLEASFGPLDDDDAL